MQIPGYVNRGYLAVGWPYGRLLDNLRSVFLFSNFPLGTGPSFQWPQASGETTLQKYRHTGTLKQAGLGVWGMRQHGESARSCEWVPPQRATRGVVLPLSC